MNILNWILFILLNIWLTGGISEFRLIANVFIWLFIIKDCYICSFLWLLLVFPLQFVFLPILYEFLNKKSQVFLFLNKLKNLIFCLKILFVSLVADIFSLFIISKLGGLIFKSIFLPFCCFGTLFLGYFSLAIWLKFRKCIFFRLRKIIKLIGKWLGKRKYVTLQNFIIVLHLIFAAELVKLGFLADGKNYLFLFSLLIIPLVLVELISLLSYAKKQKAQPFQRGIIFINSLLIFLYTQIAISILFLVDLI